MRAALRERLDAHPWAYETAAFTAIGFRFSVRTEDAELGRLVDELYAPCTTDGDQQQTPAPHTYVVRERRTRRGDDFVLYLDGARLVVTTSASIALDYLVWHVNTRAVTSAPDRLVFHAGVVSDGARAAVLPAASGAGKSTLVAGLVRAGFDYVTDEAAALAPESARIAPYPKPIALERGSWSLFDASTTPSAARYSTLTRYATPAALGGRAARDAVVPRLLVTPRYVAGSPGTLRPMHRAEAAVLLADQCFNFADYGPGRLDLVAAIVESCDCYELEVDDLDVAAGTLREAFSVASVV